MKTPGDKMTTVKMEDGTEFKMYSTPVKAKPGSFLFKPRSPTGPDPIKVSQYFGCGGTEYNQEGIRCSSGLCLPVLQQVWGRKLDEAVMAYVHSLRPSAVRITEGGVFLDSFRWRVTIYVTKVKRSFYVRRIEQEVEVTLPEGVAHGSALALALEHGVNSPEVVWHRDATGYISSFGSYRKSTAKGSVPWKFKKHAKRNPKLWRDPNSFWTTSKHTGHCRTA